VGYVARAISLVAATTNPSIWPGHIDFAELARVDFESRLLESRGFCLRFFTIPAILHPSLPFDKAILRSEEVLRMMAFAALNLCAATSRARSAGSLLTTGSSKALLLAVGQSKKTIEMQKPSGDCAAEGRHQFQPTL
jgi:hypothetical protein